MMDIIGICAAEVPVYLSYKLFHFGHGYRLLMGKSKCMRVSYTISQKFTNQSSFYREKTKHLCYYTYYKTPGNK
jgi:hypothetical protein